MRAERRVRLLIHASRALSEAVGIAAAAGMVHAFTAGRDALPIVPTALALFGATLVLSSVLGERQTLGRGAGLTVVAIGAAIAWSFALPTRQPDLLAVMTRVLGFGILGEIFLWRVVGIARGLDRWRDVRNDTLLALFVVVFAALDPGLVDRDPLPVLGLAVAVAGGIGLSLARSNEELTLGRHEVAGRAGPASATGTAFVLGILALAAVFLLPSLERLALDAVRVVGPILSQLVLVILLPLGYVAAAVAYLLFWVRDILHLGPLNVPRPPPRQAADDDLLRRLREMEEQRPYIYGATEVLIAVVAVLVAIVLVGRLMTERRARTPEGVEIQREPVEGIGLRATAALLFPRRPRPPGMPADDGTAAGRLRRIYWRLLDLAEREGPGRRAPAETPAEHERRLVASGARWGGATAVVRAFEDMRYGEVDPDPATLERAGAALARVEAAT